MLTKIALAQMDVQLGDFDQNSYLVERFIRVASGCGVELVIFPECCLTGYAIKSKAEAQSLALSLDDTYFKNLSNLCQELQIYVILGFIEKEGDKLYNSAVLMGPDNYQKLHRKVHISNMGVDRFVEEGNIPFGLYELPFGKIGFYICYDHNFPECARVMALKGAQLICLLTSWTEPAKAISLCLSRVRAFENNVFVASANRVGIERGHRYIGLSHVTDQYGHLIAQSGEFDEDLLLAEMDLSKADNKQVMITEEDYVNVFDDRRVEFYKDMLK